MILRLWKGCNNSLCQRCPYMVSILYQYFDYNVPLLFLFLGSNVRWGNKLWSSPFDISNSVHRTKSSSVYPRTLCSVTNSFIIRLVIMRTNNGERINATSLLVWRVGYTRLFADIAKEANGYIALSTTCKIHLALLTEHRWHTRSYLVQRVRYTWCYLLRARMVKLLATVRKVACRTYKLYLSVCVCRCVYK